MALDRFFLFIADLVPEAASHRLRTSGVDLVQKKLESSPENWSRIHEELTTPGLLGVLVKFTGRNLALLLDQRYHHVAEALLDQIAAVPHLAVAHETVLTGEVISSRDPEFEDEYGPYVAFHDLTDEQRTELLNRFALRGIELIPYRTNAELSVLASAFVEDNERNLLLRLYVPKGRLYSGEADRLLAVFREWLNGVKGRNVRQDGYSTAKGTVYELLADDLDRSELSTYFDDFSRFLELARSDVHAAAAVLRDLGIPATESTLLADRYRREAARLDLDLRRTYEQRVLEMKFELEELRISTPGETPQPAELEALVRHLVPAPSTATNVLAPACPVAAPVVINQFNQTAQQMVVHANQGTTHYGLDAKALLELINSHGGNEAAELQSAVHEFEDEAASATDRFRARQRLKAFLIAAKQRGVDIAQDLLTGYLESHLPG